MQFDFKETEKQTSTDRKMNTNRQNTKTQKQQQRNVQRPQMDE